MTLSADKNLSPKIKHLVQVARELFFRYGIKRVSLEEVCRESGISKVTFYRYFKNKSDLVIYILSELFTEARVEIQKIIKMNVSFAEKMQKILVLKMGYGDEYGQEFMKELFMGADATIKNFIEEENKKSMGVFRKMLEDAQKNGDIRKDIKIEFVICMMNVIKEMLKDKNLQKMYPNMSLLIKDVFNFVYYGLLDR